MVDGLRLTPVADAADAEAVFRRKIPQAVVTARRVHHPFWWVRLTVTPQAVRRGGPARPAETVEVLVDAKSGKGFIAGFVPRGVALSPAEREQHFGADVIGASEAEAAARRLVATYARRRFKLGMHLDITVTAAARPVIKPNWLVAGGNEKLSARFLVDGLDGTHWVIDVTDLKSVTQHR